MEADPYSTEELVRRAEEAVRISRDLVRETRSTLMEAWAIYRDRERIASRDDQSQTP